MGDQGPLLKLILLSPLYGSKVLFHPYCVCHVLFSLETLIPRCCRSVQTSTPGDRQEMLLAQHMSFRYFMYVISLNPQNIPVSGRTRIRIHISETERKIRGCAEVERSGNCELTHHQIISGFPVKELRGCPPCMKEVRTEQKSMHLKHECKKISENQKMNKALGSEIWLWVRFTGLS